MTSISNAAISIIGPRGLPKDFPGTSGIEAYVENQIPYLLKSGKTIRCYVHLWATSARLKRYHGIQLINIPTINTTLLDTITYSLLASIHASMNDTTIVWYHGIGPAFFAFIPKLFHKRIYTTIHSLDWNRKKWNPFARIFLRFCENIAISFSDRLFVVSTQLEKYYANTYRKHPIIDKYTIKVKRKVAPGIIRRKYDLKNNGYVLYMGRFVPEKRIEWLIGAMQRIPTMTLVLSGGSSHSDAYVRQLKTLAHDKNILFTGYVFGKEKAELLSNCKLVVLPSMLEGYPISIVEALAYGKRCLIGDFLISEYPSDNRLINYFRCDSYEDFMKKLKKLLKTKN